MVDDEELKIALYCAETLTVISDPSVGMDVGTSVGKSQDPPLYTVCSHIYVEIGHCELMTGW